MQALQTATRNPARYFGILNETGTMEEGKSADLVLLDADPLEDIRNTQKIDAVVMRGRYYSRRIWMRCWSARRRCSATRSLLVAAAFYFHQAAVERGAAADVG